MKYLLNEKGYALLMVLMLILLFTVLGMGLFAMNMNASKQFNMKEEQVQARHQAEMGVLHYQAVLKEKVTSSSASVITCSNIESILGNTKKITGSNYTVTGGSNNSSSCTLLPDGKKLEIKIKSKGIINGNTEKEVEATFYAENQGATLPSQPVIEVISPPKSPSGTDTETVGELKMRKETKVYNGNLVISNILDIDSGSSDSLKVSKNLYISGNIDLKNHACIASGGDFTALKSFNWGSSKSDLLVRKDAYLPSSIGNWQQNQVNVYIYGDLYLPITYNYHVKKLEDRNLYVGGNVYKFNGSNYIEILNPFKKLTEEQDQAINNLNCFIEANQDVVETPNWILKDDILVNYQ